MAYISIKDLVVQFTKVTEDGLEVPGTKALKGISLDIDQGSFVSVIGMNGSGKSTLAK